MTSTTMIKDEPAAKADAKNRGPIKGFFKKGNKNNSCGDHPRPLILAFITTEPLWEDTLTSLPLANIVQQTGSEGSRRRAQLNRLSEPRAIAVDNAAGRLYWTDTGVHKIYRVNLDGSQLEVLIGRLGK